MSNTHNLEERYGNDANFYQLVQVMYRAIDMQQATPQEVRDAALYAQVLWEQTHPQSIIIAQDLYNELLKVKFNE